MIRLDIFSDPVCPWCYIGKTALDRALEAAPDHPFALEWHPFQLSPDMPAGGMARAEFMALKFGSPENILRVHEPVLAQARAAGAEIDLPAITRSPNTLDAHRLIHWAGLEGRQTPVVAALFRAYWREGRDIGDAGVLAEIGAAAGLDRAMLQRLLAGDADAQMIRERDSHARARGISGVPAFIIDNRYVISGAQPAEVWGRIIADVTAAAARGEMGPDAAGQVLS